MSSAEVVETHIQHIEKVNPALNAMVCSRFQEARAEALAADQAIKNATPNLPPFHGVPCSIKEAFAVRGMPNTSGLLARAGKPADADAISVARLRKAGAIVLGVTNLSELCMWMESNNRVYGRCNNPYDTRRTAGGSSGGEGAIIGAGGAPFGLGSDIGGSIRMPAFFNGVFGHKATGGLVPNAGQHPPATPGIEEYVCTGPITRRAEDLYPLLQTLIGDDPSASRLRNPADVDVASLRVVVIENDGKMKVDPELIGSLERAAAALQKRGAHVRKATLPDLKHAFDIWSSMVSEGGGPTFAELLGEGKAIHAGREVARFFLGRSPHTLPAIGLALLEKLPALLGSERGRRFIALGQKLRNEVVDMVGPNGILLFPPHPLPAPRHNGPLLSPFRWVYTGIFNVLGLPVTAVPMGLSKQGLPLGVQVAAIHNNDHLTLAVALELERVMGGWFPPAQWLTAPHT